MEEGMKYILVLVAFDIIIFIVLLTEIITEYKHNKFRKKCTETVYAKVYQNYTPQVVSRYNSFSSYPATAIFKIDGREVRSEIVSKSENPYINGATLEVAYSPDEPAKCIDVRWDKKYIHTDYKGTIMFLVIFILITIFCIIDILG